MSTWLRVAMCGVFVFLVAGCPFFTSSQVNPFLTLTETFGVGASQTADETGQRSGTAAETEFRRTMNVTFVNNHPDAELNVSMAAWVYSSSIRSAEQQDALLSDGYVQLSRNVEIGTAFTLTPGTFIYYGPGTAGATAVRLDPAQDEGATPTTRTFSLITPDVVLAFSQPPESCESVAFYYTDDGDVLYSPPVGSGLGNIYGGATGLGGLKTLAQVDAYQCSPLMPGMFLKLEGGFQEPNEFFEGDSIQFDFYQLPDADGNFAIVTVATTS